jgi:predicted aspartyl protease
MSPVFLPVVAFCAIMALAPGAEADCQLALVSKLAFNPGDTGLIVPVTLNGQPAKLTFDTGAATTVLDLAAVNRIGLPHMHDQDKETWIGTVSGIGGAKTAMGVTATTVDIGGLKGKNYNFLAADLGFRLSDGILSIDLISQYDVDLDYPENQVVLYRPNGDCSAPAAFLNSPLYSTPMIPLGSDRRPRITVQVAGKDVTAMIDTGAYRSAIFRRAAARLGLDMASLARDPHYKTAGVGPNQVDTVRHVFEPITVGDLTFDHMNVDILDEHGSDDNVEMVLGRDFQRTVHVWISYSSGTLIMQYPPRPSKKMPGQ